IQHGFLLGRIERSLLLQFVLQSAFRHGFLPALSLHAIYRHVNLFYGVFFQVRQERPCGSS
ncbi:MAG: hypothetical protein AB7I48_06075, partial [Planctomycetaceae bacterium]